MRCKLYGTGTSIRPPKSSRGYPVELYIIVCPRFIYGKADILGHWAFSKSGVKYNIAWVETETKYTYRWSNYKWCDGSATSLTKYCTDSGYGTVDDKTVLDPEDDAAHVNWGGTWRMPTVAEMQELKDNCTSEWTTQNGVNGRKFTGSNGNSIFLPSAGSFDGASLDDAGSYGYYWSSSLMTGYPNNARYVYFNSGSVRVNFEGRYFGCSVRPVCNPQ